MNVALIMPAAGSGARLGADIAKALVDVCGQPLVAHSVARIAEGVVLFQTVIAAPAQAVDEVRAAVDCVGSNLGRVAVIVGGATRQESVRMALDLIDDAVDLVCVHDAARPLVSAATVAAVVAQAARSGAAVAAARPSDSVRQEDATGGSTHPVDRSLLWMVQTPQVFARSLLADAHVSAVERGLSVTDDAQVVEAVGHPVSVVESIGTNPKVTVAHDLVAVRAALGGAQRN